MTTNPESVPSEAFEDWASEEGINNFHFNHCWAAWQAAFAANRGISLLAEDHRGMRVDYSGMFGQAQKALSRGGKEPGLAEMFRQFKDHITELGVRWYAGDTAVVDELLQLYCVEKSARDALAASPAAPAQSVDALARELLDTLQAVVKHFTKTPSSLADSQVRGRAHEVIEKAYAQIGYGKPIPIAPAESGEPIRTHTTQPGESVMGIALRQCGGEAEWRHILACNPKFSDLLPSDYFPVGTVLTLPPLATAPSPSSDQCADGTK